MSETLFQSPASEQVIPPATRRYMTFEDVCKRQAEIDARIDELLYEAHRLNARFDKVLDSAEKVLEKIQREGIGGLMRDVMGSMGGGSRKRSKGGKANGESSKDA